LTPSRLPLLLMTTQLSSPGDLYNKTFYSCNYCRITFLSLPFTSTLV